MATERRQQIKGFSKVTEKWMKELQYSINRKLSIRCKILRPKPTGPTNPAVQPLEAQVPCKMGTRHTMENRVTKPTSCGQTSLYPTYPSPSRQEVYSGEIEEGLQTQEADTLENRGEEKTLPERQPWVYFSRQEIEGFFSGVNEQPRRKDLDILTFVCEVWTKRPAQNLFSLKKAHQPTTPPMHVQLSIWFLVPYPLLTNGWQTFKASLWHERQSQNKQKNNLEVRVDAGQRKRTLKILLYS